MKIEIINELETELMNLKGLGALNQTLNKALEKIRQNPTDLDEVSSLITNLTIKCEMQSEIIKAQKELLNKN